VHPDDVLVCKETLAAGKCTKEEKCKLYHPFEGQKLAANTTVTKVCKNFFEHKHCTLDKDCKFAHPGSECAFPAFVEVCVNDIIGKCARDDCKYYHDTDKRLRTMPCVNYPDCNRGSSCSFSHDLADRKQLNYSMGGHMSRRPRDRDDDVARNSRPQLHNANPGRECLDFFHGKCTRGSECRFEHIQGKECIDFKHGRCTRGSDCKYVHGDGRETFAVQPLKARAAPPPAVSPPLVSGSGLQMSADPSRECLDFIYNKCTRGMDCKYFHTNTTTTSQRSSRRSPDPLRAKRHAPSSRERSRDDRAPGGVSNPAKECLDFFHGRCTRGRDCRFQHLVSKEDADAAQLPVVGGAGGGFSRPLIASNLLSDTTNQADRARECLDFFHNRCTRGSECKYKHGSQNERRTSRRSRSREFRRRSRSRSRRRGSRVGRVGRVEPVAKVARMCKDYALQRCNRGDTCKYVHDLAMRCPEFIAGSCFLGQNCMLSHEEDCIDYLHDRCQRDGCRFAHDLEKKTNGGEIMDAQMEEMMLQQQQEAQEEFEQQQEVDGFGSDPMQPVM